MFGPSINRILFGRKTPGPRKRAMFKEISKAEGLRERTEVEMVHCSVNKFPGGGEQ
jgi:hypothetical protein